jgi:8-amino-7-oxononanoate synthase
VEDIFAKCHEFFNAPKVVPADELALAAEMFLAHSPNANAGPWMEIDGRRVLQLSTNNYLGLATHPQVCAAATEVVQRYGIGAPMGSRLLTGNTAAHEELEAALAAFKRCEAALVFPSGALAMMGALGCLAGPGDILLLDEFAHTTLVCGAKISGAEIRTFRHNDLDHLESQLKKIAGSRPTAIVVDGVYSMDGDLSPLQELVELKERFGARLLVDDAHGTGVFGPEGRGTAAHFDVEAKIDLHLGTFSKAFGTIGGFVAGKKEVVDFIRFRAPTFVFTKSTPLAVVAATRAALELVRGGEDLRKRLWSNTARLQRGLRERGFAIGKTQSPITPIEMEGSEALRIAHTLRTVYDIWVTPVVYPAIRLGRSILRVIPTAAHTPEDIDYFLESLTAVRASMVLGSLAGF